MLQHRNLCIFARTGGRAGEHLAARREASRLAQPFVGIQIGAISFVDEGIEPVLDTLQEKGAVNALLLASPTFTRGTGGRQIPGHPLPDHGVQAL